MRTGVENSASINATKGLVGRLEIGPDSSIKGWRGGSNFKGQKSFKKNSANTPTVKQNI